MVRTLFGPRGVAVMVTVLLLTGACKARKPGTPAASRKLTIPDSAETMAFGAKVVLTNTGVNNGELLSDTLLTYEDGTRLVLYPVNLTFFTSTGVKDGVMTAQWGTYNQRLQRLEVRGNVIVIREDGKRLQTPQLVYDQARNQFLTDSSFVLNEPSRTFTGIGFESDPRLNNFRCLRACKGVAPVQVPTR
jgi:LPS export ABC transporter protein LptC